MTDATETLLADLETWSEDTRNFHRDRELADRALLATGWRCVADPEHPAKVRWEFGKNPVVSCWEPCVPHPINSLDAALGQMPYGWRLFEMWQVDPDGPWRVKATCATSMIETKHATLTIAVTKVAIMAWNNVEAWPT
jgi:hypothetical protein